MTNFKMFLEKLEKLTLKEQKEVIAKIFGLGLVFLYSVDLEEEKIVFKVYDGRYYQFNFCFDNIINNKFLEIIVKERIVLCDIYLKNFYERNDNFTLFIKFLIYDDISYLDSFFSGWCLYSFSNSFKLIGR